MKLVFVNQASIPDSEPGITRHHALGKALVADGHEVTIVAGSFNHFERRESRLHPAESSREEWIDGVRFLWLRNPAYGAGPVRRLWSMLHFGKRVAGLPRRPWLSEADVIVGCSPYPFAAFGALRLARRLGIPFVLETRDIWPMTLTLLVKVNPWHPVTLGLSWLERHLYRSADWLVTALPNGALRAQELLGRSCGHVTWIPNGVDPSLLPEEAGSTGPERPFEFIYAGLHSEQTYALDTILDAVALLQARRSPGDFRVTFLGEGAYKDAMKARVAREGLQAVRFEDPVPKREVYGRLQRAHACLLSIRNSDLYRYGISMNKLYDYMACGLPVVFAGGACGDIVSASGGGLSLHPEDAEAFAEGMIRMMDASPEQRRQWGIQGRRFIEEHHTSPALARRYVDAAKSACLRAGEGSPVLESRRSVHESE